MPDEIERIIQDIKKCGLTVEVLATSKLEADGWSVHNQDGYLDCDEKKWRTIDIKAIKRIELSNKQHYKALHVSLIIECKKSKKPWIFYIRDKNATTFNPLMATAIVKHHGSPEINPLILNGLANHFHYLRNEHKKIAVIPYEAFTKQSGRSDIFKGTNQVIKAINYEKKSFLNFSSKYNSLATKNPKQSRLKLLCLRYPVIVFDGDLYTFTYDANEEVKINRTNYVQHLVNFEAGNGISELFVIDIVHIDYLQKYTEMINNEVNTFKEKLIDISK